MNVPTNQCVSFIVDGGPDHQLTYLSVQLSLIALYLKLELDFLCAARTPLCHSWRNPAERVMAIVNLGQQCVGQMREKMPEEFEAAIASSSNLSELRHAAEKKPDLVPAVQDSIVPVKILLADITLRLQLQGQNFQVFSAATQDDMKELFGELEAIDSSLTYGGQYRRKNLSSFPSLAEFLSHCCQSRHYSFTIKKCGQHACTICKPVRMPLEDFEKFSSP